MGNTNMKTTHSIAKKWLALCAAVVCGINMLTAMPLEANAAEPMRDMTTAQIVADMGQGINLGNTFEACGDWIDSSSITNYETAWGSPVITQEIIQGYADAGFGVLRIPVAWSNRISSDYTIDADLMNRVKQVVDWTLDTGMYAIVNLHWDGGWLANYPNDKSGCMNRYRKIWQQVSDEFADYGNHLMFESQNEELGWNTVWNQYSGGTNGKAESYSMVAEINQAFVDLIRSGKGNNPKRHLLISGYITDVQLTCDPMFRMPNDPANRCAVSMHYYIPSTFAILEEDASWGKCRSTWGTDADRQELESNMNLMQTTFADKGIPVIIGEYGCPKKNKDAASVRNYLTAVAQSAYAHKLCPVLWDVTGIDHYNRKTCKFSDAQLLINLQNIYNYKTAHTGQQTVVTTPTENNEPALVSDGTLISNLKVNDTENAADWSVVSGFKKGIQLYGDRDITAANVPSNLIGAEMIRTACDSKLYTGALGSFTAGADMNVYAAVDLRVNNSLDWLGVWTKTGAAITTSNGVTLELFKRAVKSGETVTLGTNGGSNNSANYVVLAIKQADEFLSGDVNSDGKINAVDLTLAKRIALNASGTDKVKSAADVDGNGTVDSADVKQIRDYLLGTKREFETVKAASNFAYDPNLQYHKAPDDYLKACAQQGTVEKISYQTTVYGNNLTKSAQVYLPYGYDPAKQYNIFYLMHGGGGNENSIFIEDKAMKPILDSMIMNGDIEPMIVVTPTFNGGSNDMTANAKNFWKELAVDCVPAVEAKYSTYAKSTSAADLKASRMHRAFGGFSMGSLCAWYVLLNDLDYFAYHMPLSGDCWAGNTADEKAAAVATACRNSGYAKDEYFILAATGTKDIAYGGMNPQIESMKKMTDTFTYTSDFSQGNFYYLLCEGGSHWWTGYIVHYIYDALPYFFHE